MGTLGCINDMLQRDKENRELRKRSRERLSDTRNRLLHIGKKTDGPKMSVEQLEDIRRKTLEKEELDKAAHYKAMLYLTLGMTLILLMVWLLMGCSGRSSAIHRESGWYHVVNPNEDSMSLKPIVTVKDFVALRIDSDGNGTCVIVGQISRHKQKKWAKETEKAIGRQIAFIFNDSVITCPRVNAKLENGIFQISAPSGYDLKSIYTQIRREKIDSIDSLFKDWDKDSIYYSSREKADSMAFAMDYWEASEWIDMSTHPEDHYWWGNLDTATYKKMESALREEMAKLHCSSRAEDYMKLDAYRKYKAYLCRNTDYINLMFQGFLFTEPASGLCGYLVDDIVKSRYPTAPSIRTMTSGTDNPDDEMFAKLKYQKAVWRLMNEEREATSDEKI